MSRTLTDILDEALSITLFGTPLDDLSLDFKSSRFLTIGEENGRASIVEVRGYRIGESLVRLQQSTLILLPGSGQQVVEAEIPKTTHVWNIANDFKTIKLMYSAGTLKDLLSARQGYVRIWADCSIDCPSSVTAGFSGTVTGRCEYAIDNGTEHSQTISIHSQLNFDGNYDDRYSNPEVPARGYRNLAHSLSATTRYYESDIGRTIRANLYANADGTSDSALCSFQVRA